MTITLSSARFLGQWRTHGLIGDPERTNINTVLQGSLQQQVDNFPDNIVLRGEQIGLAQRLRRIFVIDYSQSSFPRKSVIRWPFESLKSFMTRGIEAAEKIVTKSKVLS